MTMSSPSEPTITHVVIGDGESSAITALLAAYPGEVRRVCLTGVRDDARALLEAVACSDRVIVDAWPRPIERKAPLMSPP